MDILKRLSEIRSENIEREKELISMSLNKELSQNHVRAKFFYLNEENALYEYAINGDLIATKQFLYTCGRCDEYMIKNHNSEILASGLRHIGYALLSDCMPLIERYAMLSDTSFEKIKQRGHLVYCIQLVVLNNFEMLKEQLTLLSEKASKKSNKYMRPDVAFFYGLLEKDEDKMSQSINELLQPRLHRKHNGFFIIQKDILSFPAVTYAKLAALKGFNLDIDHKLVPSELIEVNPNDSYTDSYYFL